MKGVAGRLLDIDLATGKTTDYSVSDETIKKYLGGRGLGARLLYDLVPPNTDPFSPENVLMFLTGPLTGTKVPGSSKFVVVTKSPLTNGWCDSYSSGRLPVEIKKAGYDGIIVRGKANHPCYLRVDEKGAQIRGADKVWGKDSFETDRILREEEKSPNAGVTSIGPAGEKLSRYACINSELYRQAGRGGVGAVMGSKNLKAIVARSKGRVEQHDKARLVDLNKEQYAISRKSEVATARMRYGTPLTLNITHTGGILPTRNFQYGTWEDALGMIDSKGVEACTIDRRACLSCFTPCAMVTEVKEGKYKGAVVEGPEYETLSMLGSNLCINSLPEVIQANILCDSLGVDTISAGNVIGFVMECFEKGILSSGQTEGFEVHFGDGEAALEAIRMISCREGFGDIMAEGVLKVAEHIGNDSERFAMHVKGMEFPGYEPRGAFGSGLAYAVSPRGACHRRAWPPAQEILGKYPPYTAEGKAEMVKDLYDLNCVLHGLLVCDMQSKFIPMSLDVYSEYFHGVTGESLTPEDFQIIADRIETLIRMYNVREGFSREDDTLPYRTLHEPLPDGPATGQCIGDENLNRMLDEYYQVRGWDKKGVPRPETIEKYGL